MTRDGRRVAKRTAGSVAWVLLLCALVAPAPGGRSAARAAQADEPPRHVTPAEPIEILGIELQQGAEEAQVSISASAPVTWTSYREEGGDLVVELPNSVPAPGLERPRTGDGLVAAVRFELDESSSRPRTRIVVASRAPGEHSLSAHGEVLEIALRAVGGPVPAARPTPASGEDDTRARDGAEREEPAPPPSPVGTVERPAPGPPPRGVRATRLEGVDYESGPASTRVRVHGDGEFAYSVFALDDPPRIVIDLEGVVEASSASAVTIDDRRVERVRMAQFRSRPELVSRVVFDMRRDLAPSVRRTSDGLIVTFAEPGAAPAVEVADARALEEAAERELAAGPPAVDADARALEEAAERELAAGPPAADAADAAADEMAAAGDEPAGEEPAALSAAVPSAEPGTDPVEVPAAEAVEARSTARDPDEELAADPPAEPAPFAGEEPAPMLGEELVEAPPTVAVAEAEPPPTSPAPAAPSPAPRSATTSAPGPAPGPATGPAPMTDVELYEAAEIEVEPPSRGSEALFRGFDSRAIGATERTYRGEPMTLHLRDADIRDVLRSFAQISGLNVVVQPGVSGTVTVELTQVPWDQALEQILKINNLGYELEGNIMRIAPTSKLREEAEEAQRLRQAQSLSIPLRTVIQRVSYADARELAQILRSSVLSQRGSVIVDERTNTLIIKELPNYMDTVIALIENLDTPEPQVMIEARIVETTKRFTRTLGVDWGFEAIASQEFGNTTGLEFPNNATSDGGVQLLTGAANGFLNVSLGNVLNSFTLDASLQAAETEGLINILSAPKVATLNNEQASIQSGLQIPIQTIANNTVSVQFVNATLRLDVTPHVTAEGTVLMDINIQKREPQLAFAVVGATNAPIATKEARTRVIVRDGGTTVIGGIYEVSTDQGSDRVPGMSNVPILGHLFKNKRRTDENEELLIFITPRVIKL